MIYHSQMLIDNDMLHSNSYDIENYIVRRLSDEMSYNILNDYKDTVVYTDNPHMNKKLAYIGLTVFGEYEFLQRIKILKDITRNLPAEDRIKINNLFMDSIGDMNKEPKTYI